MKANLGNLPRYLPTLTEVVAPVREATASPAPEAPLPPPAQVLDTDAVLERVMLRLAPVLQARLSEIVANLVEQEIRALQPRLLEEVELMARESMAQALADELDVKTEH